MVKFEMQEYTRIEIESETIGETRWYTLPSGEKYKSVTSVLSNVNKFNLETWKKRVGPEQAKKVSIQATRRGTAMHAIVENYIKGNELFLRKQMPANIDLFNQIKPLINEISIVNGIEFPLFSHTLKTAGRTDCFGVFRGVRSIIDFKTSSNPKRKEWITNYFLQCSAYSMMIEEMYNVTIPQVVVMVAVENEQPQLFIEHVDAYRNQVVDIFSKFA